MTAPPSRFFSVAKVLSHGPRADCNWVYYELDSRFRGNDAAA